MRKIILVVLLVVVGIGAGFASMRLGSRQLSFKPHTIIYRQTSYDEAEKIIRVSVIVRRVLSDGTWQHTQINPEGPALFMNGKLKGPATSKTTDANSPEHLNFRYVKEKNRKGESEAWISPELQDILLFSTFRSDGSKQTTLEAVEVSTS